MNRYQTDTSERKGVGMSEKRKFLSAKEYLGQLEVIDEQINQNLERLANMKEDATCAGGIDYSRERVQTSTSGDKLCSDVVRYTALNEDINAEIDEFVSAKEQIIREIRGLRKKDFIRVLYKIYVQYKSIRQTAKEMKLSYSYVIEVHKKALKAFEETYKNLTYLT